MKKRLSKDARREQLLSIAEQIIKNGGADALTLITLAEQAGVTKPLTYEHFSNREGLLVQLYKRYDEKVVSTITESIIVQASTLEDAAGAVSSAYMDCVLHCGTLYEAIVSALLAYPEYSNIRTQIRNYFVDAYHEVFHQFLTSSDNEIRIKLIAIYGAIEEVGRAMVSGEISYQNANVTLTKFIVSVLSKT